MFSPLFYMGYLTITGQRGSRIFLKMPNLVLESLYLDYMQQRRNFTLVARYQRALQYERSCFRSRRPSSR
ncbi:MAG: hypothetical protein GY801_16415 [bacterium]|nr:hypothetical protein [bacterium]